MGLTRLAHFSLACVAQTLTVAKVRFAFSLLGASILYPNAQVLQKFAKNNTGSMMKRSAMQKMKDFATFPLRAFTLFEEDRFGLSSLRSERFDYVSREVKGFCLDIGCGKHNLFIKKYLDGNGIGVDVYKYAGLTDAHIVRDSACLPFPDERFTTVTLIATINHIPRPIRATVLREAYRCLAHDGVIVVTMGNPVAELLVHKVVEFYDTFLGTTYDMDGERGMHAEEQYYLKNSVIKNLLQRAGFKNIKKKYFMTQWGLNHLFTGEKV